MQLGVDGVFDDASAIKDRFAGVEAAASVISI